MAINTQDSLLADASGDPLISHAQAHIASLTDSTTGSASDTCNDTTSSVKDDLASIIAKVNAIILVLEAHGLVKSS